MKSKIISLLILVLINPLWGEEDSSEFLKISEEIVGKSKKRPLNVGKRTMGARIENIEGSAQEKSDELNNLISDNPGDSVELPSGRTSFSVKLPSAQNLDRFAIPSYGAKGTIQLEVEVSNARGESRWESLSEPQPLAPSKPANIQFPYTRTSNVRITLNLSEGGPVGRLQLNGENLVEQASPEFAVGKESHDESDTITRELIDYNFASSVNGSIVTHISSGDPEDAMNVIDDDLTTGLAFDPNQRQHLLLVDLRQSQAMKQVGLVLNAIPGMLEVYGDNSLPDELRDSLDESEDLQAGQRIQVPPSFFQDFKPMYQKEFEQREERIKVDIGEFDARYVLIRWLAEQPSNVADAPSPENLPTDETGSAESLNLNNEKFVIYEVSLIGSVPEEFAAISLVSRSEFLSPEGGGTETTIQEITPDTPPENRPDTTVVSP